MLTRFAWRRVARYGAGLAMGATATGIMWTTVSDESGKLDPNTLGIVRFGRAASTVASIGLDYKRSLNIPGVDTNDEEYAKVKSDVHKRSAEKLLALCCANGGCFIKVGQHIGALDYLLPEEYVNTMKVLHHRAPEMSLADVRAVIKEEFKRDFDDIFETFEERPLGTASLAQVHRARLKLQDDNEDCGGGEEVAVKVQRRYVKKHSFVDIQTMNFLVHTVKFFFPQFEFMWLADEMKKNLPLELSFVQEGLNAERISQQLEHLSWLKVPTINWKYTTDRVLVMEFCDGGHIDDVNYLRQHNINFPSVSKKISQMYADMIFKFGYVHCDPHPGNVLVTKDAGGEPQIILLDHGLYTQLTQEFRINYAHLWLNILNANLTGIRRYADKLGVGDFYGLFACMVSGRSWSSIQKGVDKQKKNAAESSEIKANVQLYLRQIADVLATVNRQMILIFKTNDLLRAIEHALGTQNSMNASIQMSRSCLRCLSANERKRSQSHWHRFRVDVRSAVDQFKISCYQLFLWFYWSRVGQWSIALL